MEDPEERCLYTFVYRHPGDEQPASVRVAGDFECPGWQGSVELQGPNEAGEWYTDLQLLPGNYQYKFIVDGEWIVDPENPDRSENGDGGFNSALTHVCPFSPSCVFNEDCIGQERPVCRNFACSPCVCEGEFECDPNTGRCRDLPCMANSDCSQGQVCADGRCRVCVENSECSAGQVCADGSCIDPECTDDSQCDGYTESCTDYRCGPLACQTQVFVFEANGVEVERVQLAGSFTDWAANALEMTRQDDGKWLARVNLENGSWSYKFIAYPAGGGEAQWLADPAADLSEPDGVGGENSVRLVDCSASNLEFGRCGDPELFDWKDAIMYFVMVDRFYDHDGQSLPVDGATGGNARLGPSGQYEGGDLPGVTAKLDYLNDLGVTAVWLSAPYENRDAAGAAIDPRTDPNVYSAYHGYWPSPENIDFSDPDNPSPIPAVESRIGTDEDLRTFVGEAHGRDMKVLFDYVMNHVDVNSGLYRAHPEWFAQSDGRDGRPANGFALCGPQNLWNDPYWGTRCAFTDYLPPLTSTMRRRGHGRLRMRSGGLKNTRSTGIAWMRSSMSPTPGSPTCEMPWMLPS